MTFSQQQIKIIKDHFSNFKRITNTAFLSFFKKNSDIYQLSLQILTENSNWENINNIIHSVVFNQPLPICKNCHKEMPYNKRGQLFCSSKCSKNSEEIKLKRKQTCLEKYGVDNPAKAKSIIEKTQKKMIEKYGVDNPAKSQIIKEKIRKTNQEKYGVNCTFQSELVKKKIRKTKEERHGNEKYTNVEKRIKTNQSLKYDSFFTDQNFQEVIPLFSREQYVGVNYYDQKYSWKCKKCGNVFEDHCYSHIPRCPICYPKIAGYSNMEKELVDFCKQHFPNLIENDRELIKPYELDIVIPEKKIAIEFNGDYWHSEQSPKPNRNYHLMKTELCEAQGYQLIHVFEHQWNMKKNIIKERLKHLFGIYDKKIFARNCEVKEISLKESENFLSNYHIQGSSKSSIKLGLFDNNELIAVMTFGKPRFNKNYEWELIRYATSKHVCGGAGKLLMYFERNYSPSSIISYADRCWSKGNLYRQLEFEELAPSKPGYVWTNHEIVLPRYQCQKKTLKSLFKDSYDQIKTEVENMTTLGFYQVFDCGNLVFIKKYC